MLSSNADVTDQWLNVIGELGMTLVNLDISFCLYLTPQGLLDAIQKMYQQPNRPKEHPLQILWSGPELPAIKDALARNLLPV